MELQLVLDNIQKHIDLTPQEQQHFLSVLQTKKMKKKQVLLHENEVCKFSAFVLSGCLRGYTIDNNGIEHVLQFAPPDWWIADMYSLIAQKPGQLNIDALQDTEIVLLSKSEQEKLYTEIPKFERFFRIITEKSLVAYRQRIIDSMSLTAQERYANFCTIYPTLINTLPQKQIAAYIGVTPEFLSKMRNNAR